MIGPTARNIGNVIRRVSGYNYWWNADDALVTAGNLTSLTSRNKNPVVMLPDVGQVCAVNGTDANFGNLQSFGTVGTTGQNLISQSNLLFSGLQTAHMFVRGLTGSNAASKLVVEFNLTSAGNVGFAIVSNTTEDWGAQLNGNVGQSIDILTVGNSLTTAIVQGIFDMGLATNEASVVVDGTPGNSRPANNNNTGTFPDALISFLGRIGLVNDSLASLRHVMIFDTVQDSETQTYVSRLLAN